MRVATLPLFVIGLLAASLAAAAAPAPAPGSACGPLEKHTNYDGNDVQDGFYTASVQECCDRCTESPNSSSAGARCLFFTFNPAIACEASDPRLGCCHLKNSDAGRRPSASAISGGVPQPAPTPAPPGSRNVLLVMADDLRFDVAES
jgi:hypothetical protein